MKSFLVFGFLFGMTAEASFLERCLIGAEVKQIDEVSQFNLGSRAHPNGPNTFLRVFTVKVLTSTRNGGSHTDCTRHIDQVRRFVSDHSSLAQVNPGDRLDLIRFETNSRAPGGVYRTLKWEPAP